VLKALGIVHAQLVDRGAVAHGRHIALVGSWQVQLGPGYPGLVQEYRVVLVAVAAALLLALTLVNDEFIVLLVRIAHITAIHPVRVNHILFILPDSLRRQVVGRIQYHLRLLLIELFRMGLLPATTTACRLLGAEGAIVLSLSVRVKSAHVRHI
jgi:hypothetical protein